MKKSILNIAVSALQRVAISGAVLALAFVPGRALAQRPVGVDVSSYQGSINWTSVRNSGITYAWAKATEGVTVNDGYFVGNENNGRLRAFTWGLIILHVRT